MAIDTTPSTVATNALQAIPFASLIGGPLDACIKAQASAARTSYEFINEVGLTIDPLTKEKKAIIVTFQYNSNGQLATIAVPLISIVPIPYLAINTVDIEFLANISAASSNTTESSSDSELGIDATAEASLGYGPFSLKINAKANYSSKQHSKATADSRYSVEYTMGVKVSGGQADMPAGLAAVLNILQGSITSVSPSDSMRLTPNNVDFDQVKSSTLQVTIKSPDGLLKPGIEVTLKVVPDNGQNPFKSITPGLGRSPAAIRSNILSKSRHTIVERAYQRHYMSQRAMHQLEAHHGGRLLASGEVGRSLAAAGNDEIKGVTDKNGSVVFKLELDETVYHGFAELSGTLTISAEIPHTSSEGKVVMMPEADDIRYSILPLGPESITLSQGAGASVTFSTTTPVVVKVTAKDGEGVLKAGQAVTVEVTQVNGTTATFDKITFTGATSGTGEPLRASGSTDGNGEIEFTFKATAVNSGDHGIITISSAGADDLVIPWTA